MTPINTATNTPGQPIYLPGVGGNGFIAITPDGKTAYVTTGYPRAVIPISTATNRAGKPIQIDHNNSSGSQIAITPDGETAYVVSGPHAVIPISTATNTAGQPIQLGSGCRTQLFATPELSIAITPGREDRLHRLRGRGHPGQHGNQHPGPADPPPPRVPQRDRDHRAVTCTAARSRPGGTPDSGLTPREWRANPVR